MHFRRMDEGTDADFQVLAKVHGENMRTSPDLLMGMLADLDAYRDNPYHQCTVDFCGNRDEVSFDPDHPSGPMATFEPIVRRLLPSEWSPPSTEND